MHQTPGNTDDHNRLLIGILSLFRVELNQLRAKVHASEKVLEGTPELAEIYKSELAAVRRGPRPSVDNTLEIQMLRRILLG